MPDWIAPLVAVPLQLKVFVVPSMTFKVTLAPLVNNCKGETLLVAALLILTPFKLIVTAAVVLTVTQELLEVVPVRVYVPPAVILKLLPAPIVETSLVSPGVAATAAAYAGYGAKIPPGAVRMNPINAKINAIVLSFRAISKTLSPQAKFSE